MPKLQPAVKAIVIKEGRVLALKIKSGEKELWDLPGGRIKYGESPVKALKHEVKEETGLDIEVQKVIDIFHFIREEDGDQIVATVFLCKALTDDISLNNESLSYHWLRPEEFVEYLTETNQPYIKDVISNCCIQDTSDPVRDQ
jgi:8-oxo-dGTP diphosphatase